MKINIDLTEKIPTSFPGDPEVNMDLAEAHQLSTDEYEQIIELLGRTPTYTELGIYSVMWSEHASYKNSIAQLKTLPRSGGRLLVDAGEENAGLVDIGDGLAVAFKIESHNHPSAVEPYQGAATGIGGILRDIFTMGARPIAALNSLRFGLPDDDRVRYLVDGVVRGIADYGNCFGVPTVAGEVVFEEAYTGNPLVNAMAVGLVEHDKVMSAVATGSGNPVIYVGARTGRDGIHGATFASEELSEKSEQRKSNVQVGDPFTEKLLLEATLELAETDAFIGIQDMGAAGLTCSSCEMAAKTGVGMILDLDQVPRREEKMSPYETMLSESQERMLLVAKRGREDEVFAIFKKWGLEAVEVGEVRDDGRLKIIQDGIFLADIPAVSLALGGGAPVYERERSRPAYLDKATEINSIKEPEDFEKTTIDLLSRPNIASKKWVYRQYDHMVRTNTRVLPGYGDAAVLRVPGTRKALSVTTDCNARYVYLDPQKGAAMAVAEAARNVACTGAIPIGVTNCLNFGNPYKPEVFWSFAEVIAGMGEACRALDTPVTGGNVSFYNENPKGAVYASPVIGMVGLAEDAEKTVGMAFPDDGLAIYLVGSDQVSWAGSEWQIMNQGDPRGELPELDLELEKRLQATIITGIENGFVKAAHDLAEGGLVVALAEMAVADKENPRGALLELEEPTPLNLFGEGPSRIIAAVDPEKLDEFEELAEKNDVPAEWIGTTGGIGIGFRNVFKVMLDDISDAYYDSLEKALGLK
ncbi:MAG: phosphoribosylformylglycinamidine synthase subunit PurL [Candidatus Electryonea clarkiae]|nr:phosphoribosylformylglycinamidine synthase subunit PurL [Candidatus Electryonea clarkiae]